MHTIILHTKVGTTMDFCSECGSLMRHKAEGLVCPKCGKMIPPKPDDIGRNLKKETGKTLFVVEESKDKYMKIDHLCPVCGNGEAFSWSTTSIGEHAGVRQERTIEHFRCTKCMHTWVESS
jgi:DNA-directed RNA polymerase subunit M/transcription elongation factor TFIIS